MDFDEYLVARRGHLIEHALAAGLPDHEAVQSVDEVLQGQRKAIQRAADPDPVVFEALDRRLGGEPTAPRRRWPLIAAAVVVAVALATSVGLALHTPAPPPTEQVPSLFGYDVQTAPVLLRRLGFDVRLSSVRACLPFGEIVGTDPQIGARVARGSTVRVTSALPESDSCVAYPVRDAAWGLIRFVLLGHGSDVAFPRFAGQVHIVRLSSAATRTVTLSHDQAFNSASLADALPPLTALARHRAATVSGIPHLAASYLDPPRHTCGWIRPREVDGRRALRISISSGGPSGGGTACPLVLDVYDHAGAIDTIVVYAPL